MMLPSDFELHRPATVADAAALRAELGDSAALYAGGTELLLAMKLGVLDYEHLIDVKRIGELHGVERRNGELWIGAAVTHRELETDAEVARALPALAALEREVANVRVRAAGTLAGNLAFAEPHADPPALLTALGARLQLVCDGGIREVEVEDFVLGAYETALHDDELLSAVLVPLPGDGVRATYRKIAMLERPTVGVAVVAEIAAGTFLGPPAVVVGAVDERPLRVDAAALAGASVDDGDALDAVAAAARGDRFDLSTTAAGSSMTNLGGVR
jgi:carbon-monoxide dehydrogenase medium subunit